MVYSSLCNGIDCINWYFEMGVFKMNEWWILTGIGVFFSQFIISIFVWKYNKNKKRRKIYGSNGQVVRTDIVDGL